MAVAAGLRANCDLWGAVLDGACCDGPLMKTFVLNDKQMARFNEWVEKLNPPDPYDEDCVGTSYFEWYFIPSGIGDTVLVRYTLTGERIDLTLGDDGEFVKP